MSSPLLAIETEDLLEQCLHDMRAAREKADRKHDRTAAALGAQRTAMFALLEARRSQSVSMNELNAIAEHLQAAIEALDRLRIRKEGEGKAKPWIDEKIDYTREQLTMMNRDAAAFVTRQPSTLAESEPTILSVFTGDRERAAS